VSEYAVNRRRRVQIEELAEIVKSAKLLAVPRYQVTCQGTQPSRPSGVGHQRCGKVVSIEYAFRCLYCGFWFCQSCAEQHFGMTRAEHVDEYNSFDGTI